MEYHLYEYYIMIWGDEVKLAAQIRVYCVCCNFWSDNFELFNRQQIYPQFNLVQFYIFYGEKNGKKTDTLFAYCGYVSKYCYKKPEGKKTAATYKRVLTYVVHTTDASLLRGY